MTRTVKNPYCRPANAVAAPIDLRFSDLDAYGHVNNITLLRLMEEARIRLAAPSVWGGLRYMVVRNEAEYAASLEDHSRAATFWFWASRIGGSSLTLSWTLEDTGAVYAAGATTLVAADTHNKVTPIPEDARAYLEKIQGPPLSFRGN